MKTLLAILLALVLSGPAIAGSQTYKVVRSARVNAAVAAAIRADDALSRPVTLSEDRRVTAREGFTLLKSISSGALIVVQIASDDPEIEKAEVWRKDFGDGSYFVAMCYCAQKQDDDCKFARTGAGAVDPNSCRGESCCGLVNVYVDADGTPTTL